MKYFLSDHEDIGVIEKKLLKAVVANSFRGSHLTDAIALNIKKVEVKSKVRLLNK